MTSAAASAVMHVALIDAAEPTFDPNMPVVGTVIGGGGGMVMFHLALGLVAMVIPAPEVRADPGMVTVMMLVLVRVGVPENSMGSISVAPLVMVAVTVATRPSGMLVNQLVMSVPIGRLRKEVPERMVILVRVMWQDWGVKGMSGWPFTVIS